MVYFTDVYILHSTFMGEDDLGNTFENVVNTFDKSMANY